VVQAAIGNNRGATESATLAILGSLTFCHLLNDLMQSLLPALYPMLKSSFTLSFTQIGLITFTYQVTASLLQPLIGRYTDRRPRSYLLPVGMSFTLLGLLLLSAAGSFVMLLAAAALAGTGSAVFHPEASRIARLASGGRHGFAQSFFQVGGNIGSATGPLLAAFFVMPRGLPSVAWFSLAALLAMILLTRVGGCYHRHRLARAKSRAPIETHVDLPARQVKLALAVLLLLIFSKYFYLSSLTSYYTFYLIQRFQVSVENAQIHLFVFLASLAFGTLVGGPIGDRFGRKIVIWCSILGALPFTLVLPYVDLFWTGILTVVIALILSSAFSAIVVYGQELIPGKVGMVAGLFFGAAFGMSGIGAAALGTLADYTSITFVYRVVAFLPLMGLITVLLPNLEPARRD
jgi:FSR family fosmidomycin resistance protein-like MFS transporter